MKGYTKSQVCEITGLTGRQVQFYTEQGVVIPGVDKGNGRGKFRKYSDLNIRQFRIIRHLTCLGITVKKVKDILDVIPGENLYHGGPVSVEIGNNLMLMLKIND